jgi:hypothetical protein
MTWRQGFWLGFVFLAGVGVACAGAPSSAPAPSLPSAPSVGSPESALPVVSAIPAPAASSSEPLALVPPSEAPPAAPAVLPICRAKCDKLVSKCSLPQVESCRLNCTKYDPPPAGCVAQVRAALECARDAPDLTCAHVAPESCTGKFREIAACSAGETAHNAAPAPAALPEGWERISDAAGFSLALPSGSTEQAGPDGPVRSVTANDGTIYTVSVLPLLKEKPSEKSLLHFLMKVQGRCSDKLKLDGFIEKASRSSIHFTAHCPDKTDWDGMIYIGNQHLIVLSAQAKAGKIGPTEPFFYEFEFSNR